MDYCLRSHGFFFYQRNKEAEKRLIADSFLRKKRKIQKRIFPGATVLARRPLATCIFFESFPKETQKQRILRIRIQINPLNPRRERIHWIHNPFLDFTKEKKNPFLDSESGLGFFPKNCTLRLNNLKSFLGNKKPSR